MTCSPSGTGVVTPPSSVSTSRPDSMVSQRRASISMTSTPDRWVWWNPIVSRSGCVTAERRDLELGPGAVAVGVEDDPFGRAVDAVDREPCELEPTVGLGRAQPVLDRRHRQDRVGLRTRAVHDGGGLAEDGGGAAQVLGLAPTTEAIDRGRYGSGQHQARGHRPLELTEQVGDGLVGRGDAGDRLGTGDHEDRVGVVRRVLGLPERVGLVPAADVGVDDGHERDRLARATAHLEEVRDVGRMEQCGSGRRMGRHQRRDRAPTGRRPRTGRRSRCRHRPRRRRPVGPRPVGGAR